MTFVSRKLALKITFLSLISIVLSSLAPALAIPNTMRCGMNAEPSWYASTDGLYVDLLMHAGQWNPVQPLTTNGYPTKGPTTSYFTTLGYPSGQYSFYGEGDFDLSANNGMSIVPGTLQKTGNVTTCKIQVTPPAPIVSGLTVGQSLPLSWITLSNISAANPPNNFKLIRPDYSVDTTQVFGKEYIQAFGPFSCLRFMDWMNTNGSTVTTWASRPQPNVFGDGNRNVSYEQMIALCNTLNCDMWINVPLNATPDWASHMAALIKTNLKPNLHVYYEVGNELWNTGFPAWSTVDAWAQADGFGTSWYGHGEEMGKLLMKWASIMQPVLGTQGRPILSGQFVVTDYCSGGLHYIAQQYGPPKNYIYGISGASYVSPSSTATSGGDVINQLNAAITSSVLPAVQANVALANQYGVKFTCYEGGDGLQTYDQSLFNLYVAAEQDAGMQGVINNLVSTLNSNGTDLQMFFTNVGCWTQYGFWGYLPDIRLVTTPTYKYLAAKQAALAGAATTTPPPPVRPALKPVERGHLPSKLPPAKKW